MEVRVRIVYRTWGGSWLQTQYVTYDTLDEALAKIAVIKAWRRELTADCRLEWRILVDGGCVAQGEIVDRDERARCAA